MIRISDEAKRLPSTLWSPDGDVLGLVLRSPEADGARELAFGYGRGEGSDQIVQHAGRQVLRIDRSVRTAGFDGSTVEVMDGALGWCRPAPPRRGRLLNQAA